MDDSGEECSKSVKSSKKDEERFYRENDFNLDILEKNRKLPVSREELIRLSAKTFTVTYKTPGNISLVVCDDSFIENLNATYKKRKCPTDVLAFSMEAEFQPDGGRELGDIIISLDTASKQASELGHSLKHEFIILYIHGLLHLLGYNHNNRKEEEVMFNITNIIASGV